MTPWYVTYCDRFDGLIPHLVGRVLIAVALLLASAYARAQDCVGTRPQDICEHGVSRASGSEVYEEKLTLSPARQKIGAAVWQAAAGVEATLLGEEATAVPSVSTEGVNRES